MPEFNRFPSKARPRITAVRLRKNFQKRPIGNVTVCNRKSPSLITAIFTFEICFSLLISSFTLPFIRERIFITVLFFIILFDYPISDLRNARLFKSVDRIVTINAAFFDFRQSVIERNAIYVFIAVGLSFVYRVMNVSETIGMFFDSHGNAIFD